MFLSVFVKSCVTRVPTDMKFARVKPLFKKNSRSDVGNYKPVSILSIVSKILEKQFTSSWKCIFLVII